MSVKQGWWPKYLQAPVQILFWEADELLPLLAGIALATVIRSPLPLLAGLGVSIILIKMKQRLPRRFVVNMAYRFGFHRIPGTPIWSEKEFRK